MSVGWVNADATGRFALAVSQRQRQRKGLQRRSSTRPDAPDVPCESRDSRPRWNGSTKKKSGGQGIRNEGMCLKGGDGRFRRSIRELASTLLLLLCAVRYLAGRGPDEAQGTCSSPALQLDCIGRVGLWPGTWSRGQQIVFQNICHHWLPSQKHAT